MAVALKHVSEPFPSARLISPNVPETVERVILRATAKEPKYRFGSVAEMNTALQKALDHARNPSSHPKPNIELLGTLNITPPPQRPVAMRFSPKLLMAMIAGTASVVLLASPVLAAELVSLLESFLHGEPSTSAATFELGGGQLTVIAGTVQAMSSEMAGSESDLMEAEQVQTAVMGTLQASSGLPTATIGSSGSGTPATTVAGDVYSSTPIPTAKATEPSLTPIPSPTPSPKPSSTAVPSSTPLPSDTPLPTPTPDICSSLAHGGFGISGNNVSWEISNGGSTAVTIVHIVIDWPVANEQLKKVRLGESTIWNKRDDSPATDVQSDWIGNRVLVGGETKGLKFEFVAPPAASGYDLFVEFDAGCRISAGG